MSLPIVDYPQAPSQQVDTGSQQVDTGSQQVDTGIQTNDTEKVKLQQYSQAIERITQTNDTIEGVTQEQLTGGFANFLLDNPDTLNKFKDKVNVMKRHGIAKGKELDLLVTFLDDIDNESRMENDYKEFMEKIRNPRKLNTIHTWEIRRLNLYLGMHKDKALNAYKAMKPIFGKYDENKMKSQDKEFFEKVWETLKSTYADNDDFIENDYKGFSTLSKDSKTLAEFIKQYKKEGMMFGEGYGVVDTWNGVSITEEHIRSEENSITNRGKIVEKFNKLNEERTNINDDRVSKIVIDYSGEKDKFKKDGNDLKYDGNIFTIDKFWELYMNQIQSKADEGTDFVNEDEKNAVIETYKQAIFENLKSSLFADASIVDEAQISTQQPTQNGEPDQSNTPEIPGDGAKELAVNTKQYIKIKDKALIKKITEELSFCEEIDLNESETKFNMVKVKEYLEGLKDKKWSDLKKLKGLDKKIWDIAVQIALTYLDTQESGKYNGSCSVTWIDGIRKGKTTAGIEGFQNKWNEVHQKEIEDKSKERLNPDGLPGKNTITAILGELEGSSDNSDSGQDNNGTLPLTIKNMITTMKDNILDLRNTTLTSDEANDIVKGLNGKINVNVTVNLNSLSHINDSVAGILSAINGKIRIDGILNTTDLDNKLNDSSFVDTLKKLVPDSGNLVIEVPTQDIKDKLAGKGISKVEIATTQTTTPVASATADPSGALDEVDGDEGE